MQQKIQDYNLIIESQSFGFEKCGCYVKNQEILQLHKVPVSVPLRTIDYQLEICNSVARIILEQVYLNPTEKYLQLEYSTPIDEKVCIYKFNAVFEETQIQGVVKQKEEAEKEYQQAVKQGKQVAIGNINSKQHDIFNIKIGNISPKSEVKIKIQYLYDLKVNLNMFWKIILQSNIWPRSSNSTWKDKIIQVNKLTTKIPDYTWCFKITLNTSQKIVLAKSTSHKLKQIITNENGKEKVFILQQGEIPNKDFVFIYTTQNFSKATSIYSRTDTSQTLLVSFIPSFNDLELNDAENMEQQGKDYETSIMYCKGQFIFMLDRSGSMSGSSIKQAKNALLFFLKSLPSDSYFNVVSFGSSQQFLFKQSVKITNQIILEASIKISTFQANLGGTDIYNPLKSVFNHPKIKNYPRQIFLLTDGGVYNTSQVLSLIKKQSKYSTVHGIGIGSGCSKQLIQGCKQTERGQFVFIQNNQEPTVKIIGLLQKTLTLAITDFAIQYDEKHIQTVIPNPKQLPYFFKNDPVNLYFMFKQINFEGSFNVVISYTDPITKKSVKQNITTNIPSESNFGFLDKKAQHTKLSLICSSIDQNISSNLLLVKPQDIKKYAIKQSIKHQVLCSLTTFICVNKSVVDSQLQQVQDIGSVSITVPQIIQQNDNIIDSMTNNKIPQTTTNNFIRPSMIILRNSNLIQSYHNLKCLVQNKNYCQRSRKTSRLLLQQLQQKSICLRVGAKQMCLTTSKSASIGSSINSAFKRGAKSISLTCNKIGNFFKSKPNIQNQPLQPLQQLQILQQSLQKKQQLKQEQKVQQSAKIYLPIKELKKPIPTSSHSNDNILMNLQNIDGSWNQSNSKQIISCISISESKYEQFIVKYKYSSFVLTAIVIHYLQQNNNSKFILILKKAKQWLKVKSKEYSISEEDIKDIQSIFI